MNMKTKIIKICASVILAIIVFYSGYYWSKIEDMSTSLDPKYKYSEIYFSSLNMRLYFIVKTWGLLGQHSAIVITTNNPQEKGWKYNSDMDYKFTTEELFYKPQGDSLIIYSNLMVDPPKKFNSDIVLVLKKLSYDEYSKMIYWNRERSGFSRVGI